MSKEKKRKERQEALTDHYRYEHALNKIKRVKQRLKRGTFSPKWIDNKIQSCSETIAKIQSDELREQIEEKIKTLIEELVPEKEKGDKIPRMVKVEEPVEEVVEEVVEEKPKKKRGRPKKSE